MNLFQEPNIIPKRKRILRILSSDEDDDSETHGTATQPNSLIANNTKKAVLCKPAKRRQIMVSTLLKSSTFFTKIIFMIFAIRRTT